MCAQLYKARYDFKAEGDGEMDLSKGEMLRLGPVSGAEEESQGWTLVESLSSPFRRGFVPTSELNFLSWPSFPMRKC